MKLIWLILLVTICSCQQQQTAPAAAVAKNIVNQIDAFSAFLNYDFKPALNSSKVADDSVRRLFLQLRLRYKNFEWAAAYFTPGPDRLINGPPVPEVERSGLIKAPRGLQVIEGLLYPSKRKIDRKYVLSEVQMLTQPVYQTKIYFEHIQLSDWQIWEAARMEVFRVLCLGLSGFDSPEAGNNTAEAGTAIEALRPNLALYTTGEQTKISAAARYLENHRDFNSFDRAYFITSYGNPISKALLRRQQALRIAPLHYSRLLNQNAATLFDKDAFNPYAFSEEPNGRRDTTAARKGEMLFHDVRLSGDMTRSCASCHRPELFFTDGLKTNTVIGSTGKLARKTPTLLNAAMQPAQFSDMRVITLEQQVADVINSQPEMHGDLSSDSVRLSKDPAYGEVPISQNAIRYYLAAYVRSLTFLNSRFDEYMRGNATALNHAEIAGFNLFMGKARCGTCHYMPLFNGALPPMFERMDAEVIGVPGADPGQYRVLHAAPLLHAFKTPGVRNTARLRFFMHNGHFSSLEQVLDFYNKGGLHVANQTLSPEPLQLDKKERRQIMAFINSLNSNLNSREYQ